MYKGVQKCLVIILAVNGPLSVSQHEGFFWVAFMLRVTVNVFVRRYRARLQCVPRPQYCSADAGGALCWGGPYLQQEE